MHLLTSDLTWWIAWYNRDMSGHALVRVLWVGGIVLAFLLFGFFGMRYGVWGISEQPIAFDVVLQGSQSPIADQKNFVIVSLDEWRDLWLHVHGDQEAPLPAIDFSRYAVLALFQGERPSGGYELQVKSVTQQQGSVVVSVDDIAPGQGCEVPAGKSTSFVFIAIQKFTGSLATEMSRKIIDCTR
jgi:PrcB C-terminal